MSVLEQTSRPVSHHFSVSPMPNPASAKRSRIQGLRVLVDFYNSLGGAPRSQLEYLRSLRELGAEAVSVIDPASSVPFANEVEHLSERCYRMPPLRAREAVRAWGWLRRYHRILADERPAVVLSNRWPHAWALRSPTQQLGIRLIFAQAGAVTIPWRIAAVQADGLIFYSKEARESAEWATGKASWVIENRIPRLAAPAHASPEPTARSRGGGRVCVVNNLYHGNRHGLEALLQQVARERAQLLARQARIEVVGEVMIPAPRTNRVAEGLADASDRADLPVHWAGFRAVPAEYVAGSDLVLGKGRSVLEPVVNGLVPGCVLSERGHLFPVRGDLLEELATSNMSGRGVDPKHSFSTLEDALNALMVDEHGRLWWRGDDRRTTVQALSERFGVDGLGAKLEGVIASCVANQPAGPSAKAFMGGVVGAWLRGYSRLAYFAAQRPQGFIPSR